MSEKCVSVINGGFYYNFNFSNYLFLFFSVKHGSTSTALPRLTDPTSANTAEYNTDTDINTDSFSKRLLANLTQNPENTTLSNDSENTDNTSEYKTDTTKYMHEIVDAEIDRMITNEYEESKTVETTTEPNLEIDNEIHNMIRPNTEQSNAPLKDTTQYTNTETSLTTEKSRVANTDFITSELFYGLQDEIRTVRNQLSYGKC